MAKDSEDKIKIVSRIAAPPSLSDEDIARIWEESRQLSDAFEAHTASMELLTADDLKIRIK